MIRGIIIYGYMAMTPLAPVVLHSLLVKTMNKEYPIKELVYLVVMQTLPILSFALEGIYGPLV